MNIRRSLKDLLGSEHLESVCEAQSFLSGRDKRELLAIAEEKVDFFPEEFQARLDSLLERVGSKVCHGLENSFPGASTDAFAKAQCSQMAPLAAIGFLRVGEDGRLRFTGKSEHYHASLGHAFPGCRLIELAQSLGIGNMTHNNTRGYITRLLERELVRVANGVPRGDAKALEKILASREPHVLNRVVNLETGSLAVEAALKMMLARFYRLDESFPAPPFEGKTPVFIVMSDYKGGAQANYHGTTILAQTLRGIWPDFSAGLRRGGLWSFEPARINDLDRFKELLESCDCGERKVAGFIHELVLMNYGGIKLEPDYVRSAHALCAERGIPVLVDEIQSCMWSPEAFMFREYGLRPDFVAVGKGFPGGLYPASKLLACAPMDSLNQFGALVTNGQEELASLAYLVTMEFAAANRERTREIGAHYRKRAQELADEFPEQIARLEGEAHMTTFFFKDAARAVRFCELLNQDCCIDISAQTYKADCPPAALTKLPLISSRKAVDFVIGKMAETLKALREGR